MNLKQMKAVLASAEALYRDAGDEASAGGLAVFSNLLNGKETETVASFIKRVDMARQPALPKPPKKSGVSRSKK